jgi:hypothetical protein
LHVFDTFEGHPEGAITSHDVLQSAGRFGGTNYDKVRKLLAPFTQLSIHKGDVADQLPHLQEDRYRLVHIDTDLYQPTVTCLDYFGRRMSAAGVIVIDDYGAPKCPGVAKPQPNTSLAQKIFRRGTRAPISWCSSTMKILFCMRSTVYVRNFESTLRMLAERGHQVQVVADRHWPESDELLERLCSAYPSIQYSEPPIVPFSAWSFFGSELRAGMDYLRYLGPEFEQAAKLRVRAERNAPPSCCRC